MGVSYADVGDFVLLLALAAYWYPPLPAARVATHFNWAEQPEGWQARDEFFATFLGFAAPCVVLNGAIVIIALGRWGAHWQLDPARGLIYTGVAFALMNLILSVVLGGYWLVQHARRARVSALGIALEHPAADRAPERVVLWVGAPRCVGGAPHA